MSGHSGAYAMQFVAVDVGTQSVRAALVTEKGKIVKTATCPLDTWNPQPDFYQQSSEQVWRSCCTAVKEATKDAKDVKGIGFDATCSLVVLDAEGQPLTISPKGEPEQNIILWMDHRAVEQAEFINQTDSEVLRFVGGRMSPEMEPPKLLWLKQVGGRILLIVRPPIAVVCRTCLLHGKKWVSPSTSRTT